MKTQLEYYCYNSFPHKTFRGLQVEILYWGLGLAIWGNTYGKRQLIMKYQTWNVMVPNAIQITNSKQEASNKEFKAETYKKASLSTSLTNLYVTKLYFAIEIKYKNWLVQSSKWKHQSSMGWHHSDVLLMIWTSHFLLSVSREPNKVLSKTWSNLVASKAK